MVYLGLSLIPPLNVGNRIVADFKEKASLHNELFASKSTLIINICSLPRFVDCLSAINFNDDDILKITRSLNINKGHGYDNISITMMKICDKATIKPLSIIYENCIDIGIYSHIYGRNLTYTVQSHKTGD